MSAEATVVRSYIDWLTSIPWKKASKIKSDIVAAREILDADHYGLDKVRFTNATPSGSQYRGRVSLMEFDPNPRGAKYKLKVIIELKGQEKPACVAELLALAYKK